MERTGWWEPIDAYCERTDASFWSEPINAVTNFAFLVAALVCARELARVGRPDPVAALLIALIALIGIGSFLFHTVATRWAALADVLPIALFIHLYLWAALRRFLAVPPLAALAVVVAFFVLSRLAVAALAGPLGQLSPTLASSAGYLPAALAIFVVAAFAGRGREEVRQSLAGTGLIFLVSLTFRSADLALCSAWGLGTHWLWHLLNAVVLARLTLLLVRAAPPRGTATA